MKPDRLDDLPKTTLGRVRASKPDRLVATVQEAALCLRVSEKTVRRWISESSLVAFQIGEKGHVRVMLPLMFRARLRDCQKILAETEAALLAQQAHDKGE